MNAVEEKTEAVYCACGAQWHGTWVARASVTIRTHQARWATRIGGCWSVPHDYFAKHHKCMCADCVAIRRRGKPSLKSQVIRVTFTKDQKRRIVAAAKAARLSQPDWLASVALAAVDSAQSVDAVGLSVGADTDGQRA